MTSLAKLTFLRFPALPCPRPECRLRRDALGASPVPLDRRRQHRGSSSRGGCCVGRRLIVVCFASCLGQRCTSRRPRGSLGARRCRTTPGRARRRCRRGRLVCWWWRSNAALPRKSKIEIRPFHPKTEPARASPIDHCRHWRRSAMVQRASAAARDKGGEGYQAVSRHFYFSMKCQTPASCC